MGSWMKVLLPFYFVDYKSLIEFEYDAVKSFIKEAG